MDNNRTTISYAYEGNIFELKQCKSWHLELSYYIVRNIHAHQAVVRIPDSFNGFGITKLWLDDNDDRKNGCCVCKGVEVLHIPYSIDEIRIQNNCFPDLKLLEVDATNQVYTTDGVMLLSKDKRKLFRYFRLKSDSIVIPQFVSRLEANSLSYIQFDTLVIENDNILIDDSAFEHTDWIQHQGSMITFGNLLFHVDNDIDVLRIPDTIKRWQKGVLKSVHLDELVLAAFPPQQNFSCGKLVITSPVSAVDVYKLPKIKKLAFISLPENHYKYKTRDGVLFTRDMKTLVYYPSDKKDVEYRIPEGVKKISQYAFYCQQNVQKISMPDTVTVIGTGAFFKCKKLYQIDFSDNIKEFPDSCLYRNGGLCECCERLKKVKLPKKLQYMGSYAFYHCGLEHIELNPQIEQIGEYALCCTQLHQIALPHSLKRIGKGALMYIHTITAFEGRARGIVSAVNAAMPDISAACANTAWTRCSVTVLDKGNRRRGQFIIPKSLKRTGAYHLDTAWNQNNIDYDEYDLCFYDITDDDEKMEFAEMNIMRITKENAVYEEYFRRVSYRLAAHLLAQKNEQAFLKFLRKNYLTADELKKLLKLSDKMEQTTCSAYIMAYKKDSGITKKKRRR